MGYRTTADDELHFGPQTYEETLDIICKEFTCLPDEAERQSWPLVQRILLVRSAKAAVLALNQGDKGAEYLAENPHLTRVLKQLHEAQGG